MEQEMTFEEAMKKLNLLVRQMEQGEASLEQSLVLFQEGTELVRFCSQKLSDAKLKVQQVMAGSDGQPVLEDFVDETTV